MTLELKSLKSEALALLEADGWTIEKLATATARELIAYKGIGRVGAAKAIAEAAEILNTQGLDDADRLAEEHYYQKAPPAKILTDWEGGGLPLKSVALTSARALAALKGIDEALDAAFDEKWLSGEVEPPLMSNRIRRNFEAAQREYRVANG
jgi:hypothetical protein